MDVPFRSVLWPSSGPAAQASEREAQEVLADLGLAGVFAELTAEGCVEAALRQPLADIGEISYRQAVFADLEAPHLAAAVAAFREAMDQVRRQREQSGRLRHADQAARWLLTAADSYRTAVRALHSALADAAPASQGLQELMRYLGEYLASPAFLTFEAEAEAVRAQLAAVRFTVELRGTRVTVRRAEDVTDLSGEIADIFGRFRQAAAHDDTVRFADYPELNRVEEGIVDRVALLHPKAFAALRAFSRSHQAFPDETIARFDREVAFYLMYLGLCDEIRTAGQGFCRPTLSEDGHDITVSGTFDLALAAKLSRAGGEIVPNDLTLADAERIIVVTGPNQGGKTTFARTFGQLHYLARLGCPVPGKRARLRLCDRVYTHFERAEQAADLQGKLQDELLRLRTILAQATDRSVVVMNESFASTTLRDALFLGREVMARLRERGLLCVYVTFIDELAAGDGVVSMVSQVAPDDPTRRTFRVVRGPANGLAYAMTLAERHGVTLDALRRRLAP